MKKWLKRSTWFTLLLSGWLVPKAWSLLDGPPKAKGPDAARPKEFVADAAYRHMHNLPNHWRAYVIQR